ncbi:hypothetical protein N431DRAFT_450277 [Stipitochalara longipes BDJ]|nr:hypothetical protein N431DRAFT_450277 [Stipitochalara longipes BDJ]
MASTTSDSEKLLKNEHIEFVIVLNENDLLTNQLGSSPVRNVTEEEQYTPRELVTEKESLWRRFYFHVRCHKPRFGVVDGAPACLIVFDHAFTASLTKSRFKRAKVEVVFEDSSVAFLDPDDDANDDAISEAARFHPKVVAYEPRLWHGVREKGEGSTQVQANLTAGDPGGAVSTTAGITRQTPFVKDGSAKIQGVVKGRTSSEVTWSIDENEMSSSGFVTDFSTPIIVQYTKGRKFAARVKVTALVGGIECQ